MLGNTWHVHCRLQPETCYARRHRPKLPKQQRLFRFMVSAFKFTLLQLAAVRPASQCERSAHSTLAAKHAPGKSCTAAASACEAHVLPYLSVGSLYIRCLGSSSRPTEQQILAGSWQVLAQGVGPRRHLPEARGCSMQWAGPEHRGLSPSSTALGLKRWALEESRTRESRRRHRSPN